MYHTAPLPIPLKAAEWQSPAYLSPHSLWVLSFPFTNFQQVDLKSRHRESCRLAVQFSCSRQPSSRTKRGHPVPLVPLTPSLSETSDSRPPPTPFPAPRKPSIQRRPNNNVLVRATTTKTPSRPPSWWRRWYERKYQISDLHWHQLIYPRPPPQYQRKLRQVTM
jgi:hypothetical protein